MHVLHMLTRKRLRLWYPFGTLSPKRWGVSTNAWPVTHPKITKAIHLQMLWDFSPNRFTCEGFLLWKGCILGPHDFTCVSGLLILLEVRFGCSTRMISHVSPTCHRSSPTCLPARSGCSARMILLVCWSVYSYSDSVIQFNKWDWFSPSRCACERFCGACSGRVIWCFGPHDFALLSHSSPSCFPLHSGFSARVISGLTSTCLPLVSHYSTCWMLWMLGSLWFRACLPLLLSPTTFSILCARDFKPCLQPVSTALARMDLFPTYLPLHSEFSARMISGLSPSAHWMI